MHLVERATAMRCDRLVAMPYVRPGPGFVEAVRKEVDRALHHAHVLKVLDTGDRLHAWVALWHEPDGWYGAPVTHLEVDAAPHAVPWVLRTLAALAPFPDDTEVFVDAAHGRWLRHLAPLGLYPNASVLVGEPATALAALGDGPTVDAFTALGLRLTPLGPRWADAGAALEARWYGAHPEYAWFATTPKALARTRHELATARNGWAVVDGDRLLGILRADVRQGPIWGRCAGMDLVLDPVLHRRGLARPAYRLLLREAVAQGAVAYKGGTSQAGVIRLAEQTSRRAVSWILRRTPTFPWSHWRSLAP